MRGTAEDEGEDEDGEGVDDADVEVEVELDRHDNTDLYTAGYRIETELGPAIGRRDDVEASLAKTPVRVIRIELSARSAQTALFSAMAMQCAMVT